MNFDFDFGADSFFGPKRGSKGSGFTFSRAEDIFNQFFKNR